MKVLLMENVGKIYSRMAPNSLVFLLLLLTFHGSILVPSSALVPVEQDVLLTIKNAWNDPNGALSSWTQRNDCSNWKGITCDENGHVKKLELQENQLSGPLPSSIGKLTYLKYIQLQTNQLYGSLPESIGELTNLVWLLISGNKFSGSIPSSFANLVNVNSLWLHNNQLSGPIPPLIGALKSVQVLNLGDNKFSGPIPPSIGKLFDLGNLNLKNNSLTGPIPNSFGNFKKLTILDLSVNKLDGSFPSSFLTLNNIQKLYLNDNLFNGPLPSSIGDLYNLGSLYLNGNLFDGPLPSSISNLINLDRLDLSSNQFSGPIPSSIGKLTKLKILVLNNNQFSGPLPPSIGMLTNLYWLFLSANKFSGTIPPSFANLVNVNSLWLFENQFSGPIPPFLGALKSITLLYVSYNYFTGNSIKCKEEITGCDQTFNCLKGITNQRSDVECSSFCGANSALGPCGGHGTCAFNAQNKPVCACDVGWALPNCEQSEENSTFPSSYISTSASLPASLPASASTSSSPSPSSSLSPSPSFPPFSPIASSYFPLSSSHLTSPKPSSTNLGLIFGIISPIVLFLIIFLTVVCLLFIKYKKKENLHENISTVLTKKEFKNEIQKLVLKNFSLREIQVMTRGFDVSMILGSGGFGTVYKGIMPGGEMCGVKKAHRTSIQSLNDFQKEVFALAQLNHFNIVKLFGYCDEANENILVYEYMENGSLSKMLRLPKDHPHFLTFEKRVQIARDCALGLHYLHNLSNKQLIHRDVKSDNILLDAKFTAKIADFGLLKIQDENLSAIQTSPCGTPGYIDPEYFITSTLTNKSDVYSFGVVLLELITGKRSILVIDDQEAPNGKSNQSLVSWARPILQSNNLDELIDPNLKEEYEPTSLQSLASLAASCLRPSQKDRPGMDEVSSRLGVIIYGKDLEIQEGESHAINVKGDHDEFILTNDENISSSNSSISNRVPVMSKSFRPR